MTETQQEPQYLTHLKEGRFTNAIEEVLEKTEIISVFLENEEISSLFKKCIRSTSQEDFFRILDTILTTYQGNEQVRILLEKYLIRLSEWRTSETYAYISQHHSHLLENSEFARYLAKMYNPERSIIGTGNVDTKTIVQYFYNHLSYLNPQQTKAILLARISQTVCDQGLLEKLYDAYKDIDGDSLTEMMNLLFQRNKDFSSVVTGCQPSLEIRINTLVMNWSIALYLQNNKENPGIAYLQSLSEQSIEGIYNNLNDEKKQVMLHIFKGSLPLTFADEEMKDMSSIASFFMSAQKEADFRRYITKELLQKCDDKTLVRLLTVDALINSSGLQKYIIDTYSSRRAEKNIFIEKIPKEDRIKLMKNNYKLFPFLLTLFKDITYEEQLEIYTTIPRSENKHELEKIVFDAIYFGNLKSFDFAFYYPDQGFVNPNHVHRGSNQHYDVGYTHEYQYLLERQQDEGTKKVIEEALYSKLRDKVLIDLGCGQGPANTAAVAYQSNASAFIGIDVNVGRIGIRDAKLVKERFIRDYNVTSDTEKNTTVIKTVFDNFDNFLEKAPSGAGYNFTINGLTLTNSTPVIKKHINRLMKPGNIIVGNNTENIYLEELLTGPFKHTKIHFSEFGSDYLHIYEKLETKEIILAKGKMS